MTGTSQHSIICWNHKQHTSHCIRKITGPGACCTRVILSHVNQIIILVWAIYLPAFTCSFSPSRHAHSRYLCHACAVRQSTYRLPHLHACSRLRPYRLPRLSPGLGACLPIHLLNFCNDLHFSLVSANPMDLPQTQRISNFCDVRSRLENIWDYLI